MPGQMGRMWQRLFLAEGFLATSATWGNQHFPALHGGASPRFLGAEPSRSPTPTDRKRVAKLGADEIDEATRLGAVPRILGDVGQRLLAADAPELKDLRLDDLLAIGRP